MIYRADEKGQAETQMPSYNGNWPLHWEHIEEVHVLQFVYAHAMQVSADKIIPRYVPCGQIVTQVKE